MRGFPAEDNCHREGVVRDAMAKRVLMSLNHWKEPKRRIMFFDIGTSHKIGILSIHKMY